MIKGAIGLIVRFALYALGAALAGAGVATLTAATDTLCINIKDVADYTATAVVMIVTGSTTFLGTAVWSRIVKRAGGVT